MMFGKVLFFSISLVCVLKVSGNLKTTEDPNNKVPGIPENKSNQRKLKALVGGSTAIDITNFQNFQKVQSLANYATQQLNRNWYGNSWALRNVISGTSQVVSGALYTVTFTIGRTVCANNPVRTFK